MALISGIFEPDEKKYRKTQTHSRCEMVAGKVFASSSRLFLSAPRVLQPSLLSMVTHQ